MRRVNLCPSHACIIYALALFLCATCVFAQDRDRPSGFTGYLLDSTGLDTELREPSWREDFETNGVSWRFLYQDGAVKIQKHSRVDDCAQEGERSEYIQYQVETPGVVVLGHYVDYPCAYGEADPSVWIRSDRPGASLAALVVFPNSLRPDTDRPITAIVTGQTYVKTGEWQQLQFSQGFDKGLEEVVQAIRGEHKLHVDAEQAYIRQILVISEARSGRYSFWLDNLTVTEHVRPDLETLKRSERAGTFDPVNLLGQRLFLSKTPIFGYDLNADSDLYGKEPFGIDTKLAEEKTRKALKFGDEVSRPNLNVSTRSSLQPIASDIEPHGSVGQVDFVQDSLSSAERVSNAAFSVSEALASDAFDAPDEDDALIVGSGTLSDPEDAITEAFVGQDGKLVANVHFKNGILESVPDGKAYSIRAIEYQGESFEFLKNLGFNAVWMHNPPDAGQLQEANNVGIWIIAPPPYTAEQTISQNQWNAYKASVKRSRPEEASLLYVAAKPQNYEERQIERANVFGGARASSAYDPVLMWNVGASMERKDLELFKARVDRIRALDPLNRPLIGSVYSSINDYLQDGRLDVALLDRTPLLTSLDMNDYAQWLVRYKRLSTNSRPVFWNTIQTQCDPSATLQRQYFGEVDESPGVASYEQIRQLVRLSMFAECHGLLFKSYSRLDSKDLKTQYRAQALELINLELQLIQPWFTMGKPDESFVSTTSPTLGAITSRTKRSILVTPVSIAPNNQYVMGSDATTSWSGLVATREGYSPDLLTPGALRKVNAKRRAGGSYFTVEQASLESLLFFTQSDAMSQKTAERAPLFGKRMATLAIGLAKKRVDLYEQTVYRLKYIEEHGYFPKSAPSAPSQTDVVSRAEALIAQAETFLARGDASEAYLTAEKSTRQIREIERQYWTTATQNEVARPVTPLSTSFYDMPEYLELYDKLLSGRLRPSTINLINGGDMENTAYWNQSGWFYYTEYSDSLEQNVTFDTISAHGGQRGLHIQVGVKAQSLAPSEVETPLVFIEVPIQSQVGRLVCIQGWIKIPKKIENSVDGLEIYDNQGGRALGLRFTEATDWKRFAFYRVITNQGVARLRFAFSGVGEVYLDDVGAYVVE
ncbi:MAG: hypothetical protein Q4G03_07175 [Planctomycetia bacterium]|nr:hypothetical protein [Planctomycetia bacterium]